MQKIPSSLHLEIRNVLPTRFLFLTFLIIAASLFSLVSVHGQQWTPKSDGLHGGHIKAIWAQDNLMLAGTETAGVFRSTDAGISWKLANTGLTNKDVSSFVASGDSIFAGTFFAGVHFSLDKGQTWQASNTGLTNTQVTSLIKSGKSLYAGTVNGIFKSSDLGKTWQHMSQGLPAPTNPHYQYGWINKLWVHGNRLFAGMFYQGLFVSDNQGQTWTRETSIPETTNVSSFVANGATLFLGTHNEGIHVSVDGGDTWTKIVTALQNETVFASEVRDGKLYAGTSSGLFRSDNNGSSWSRLDIGYNSSQIAAMATSSKGIFAGMRVEGIIKSTDGTTWTSASKGLTATTVNTLAKHENNFYAGTTNGVFRSSDLGASWNRVVNSIGQNALYDLVVNGDSLIASTYQTLYLSTDAGATWNFFTTTAGLGSSPQMKFAHRGDLYATTQTGLYLLRKGKSVWEKAFPSEGFQYYHAMAASGDTLVASSWGGRVYVSKDNGHTWNFSNTGLPSNYAVMATVIHKKKIFITMNEGIFSSDDLGVTWTKINNPGSSLSVMSFHSVDNHLFAGTFYGLYSSRDFGLTWISGNDDQTQGVLVQSFADIGDKLYAGTTEGIYATSLSAFEPQLLSFEPTTGVAGEFITIKGKNFSHQMTGNSVKINGVAAEVVFASATIVAFKIPNGAVSGPISLTSGGTALVSSESLCIKIANLSVSKTTGEAGVVLSSSADTGNQWYFNDVIIPGAINKTLSVTESGQYKVRVTDPVCFSETSYDLIITSISDEEKNSSLAYPVPMTDWVTVSLKEFNEPADVNIEMLTTTGSSVRQLTVSGGTREITMSTSEFRSGFYLLRVRQNSRTRFQRLFKQ